MASNTPRKVNAAQLAKRKIKAPTRRAKTTGGDDDVPLFAPMPGSSTFGAPAGGNAFSTGPSSANNSFNFAAPLQANFGSSVSFPPSTRGPSPSLMNGTSSSTSNGGLFGQSTASNPPVNFFGSTPQPQAQGGGSFSFGAASTQNQPSNNTFSFGQGTQSQSATSSGFNFNQSTTQSAPINNPFQTTQASSSTPVSGFGSTPATNTGGGFSFTANQPSAQPASPFTSFGNSAPTEKPATPSFEFGQTQSQQGGSQAGSLPGSQTPSRAASPAAFTFGSAQPPATEAPTGNAFVFGQKPATPKPPSNFFGQAATPSTAPPSNLFGQAATPSAAPPSNLFGQATPASAAPTTNIFGKPKTQDAAQPLNPFAPKTGNPFASIKVPDAPASPGPSSNFFGSQPSRSVSPEKDMELNGTAPVETPSLFGAQNQQPTVANNLFHPQPVSSPPKSIFSNLGNAPPVKPLFEGGSSTSQIFSQAPKSATATDLFGKPKVPEAATPKPNGSNIFGNAQTPKSASTTDLFGKPKVPEAAAATPKPSGSNIFGTDQTPKSASATDLFGKPKISEAATPKASVNNIFGSAQKPAESISIFSQSGQSFESTSTTEQTPTTRVDSPLSEISNGAKSSSRNASAPNPKLSEINSATRFNPPTPQPLTKSPTRTNQSSQLEPTPSTALIKLPQKSEMEITSLKKVILERAAEYDETNFFSNRHKTEIARIIAKYFPDTISPRQQLEAYAAIQIKHLKRCAEQDLEKVHQPHKRMKIKEQLADSEQDIRNWSVLQAKKAEKRKADSLTENGDTPEDSANKRQKPSEQRNQNDPIFGSSPAKVMLEKAQPDTSATPKAVSSPKNLFEPKTVEVAPSTTPKSKRKADVQLTKDDPTGDEATPSKNSTSNGSAPSSATANLFRNIVGNNNTPVSTPEKPMFSMNKKTTATTEGKPKSNPFASLAIPKSPTKSVSSITASPLKQATPSAGKANPATTAEPKAGGGFVFKPTQSTTTEPKAGGGFVFKPTQSTSGPTDFLSQFAQAAKKTADTEMQKAKDDDWDEDDETEAEWEARYHKEQAAKKALIKDKPVLTPPKFGSVQAPTPKEKANDTEGTSASNQSAASSPGSVLDEYVPGSGKIGSKLANPFAHLSDVESGSPTDAPSPSPMFGKHAVTAPPTPRTTGFNFGASISGATPTDSTAKSEAPTAAAPKSAPFSFLSNGGGMGPASSLGTSRATTPGVTTDNDSGDSTADNVARSHDDNDPGAELPQQSDLAAGDEPGEEAICSMKAKARKLDPSTKKWDAGRVGTIKFLRNEKTNTLRYLMRLPNGSVALNKSFLNSPGTLHTKSVVFLLPADADRAEGAPPVENWNIAFGSSEDAKRFHEAITAKMEKK